MAEQAIVEEFKKLFQDQQLQQQFVANQGAYVGEHFPPGCTPEALAEGAQEALQSAGINQGAYVGYGGGAPPYTGGEAGLVSQIAYYTSVYNNTTIDDRDVAINNQINALGDVDVDNTVASGDGAVAIGDVSGDYADIGIATGDNATAAGDVEGSVAGAGGTAIGGDAPTTVEDTQIGSASAGGDVTQQQQQQDIDVDLPEPPPPPPPPNGGGDPGADVT